jgi:hypothetical protein
VKPWKASEAERVASRVKHVRKLEGRSSRIIYIYCINVNLSMRGRILVEPRLPELLAQGRAGEATLVEGTRSSNDGVQRAGEQTPRVY